MVAYILALALLVLTLLVISLQKTYYFYPVRELKRQARSGDREAGMLYRAVAYSGSLRLLLWLIIGLAVSGSFALLTRSAPAWIVFIAIAGFVWYAFAWSPNAQVTGLGARWALLATPVVAGILYYAHPILDPIARYVDRHRPVIFHTGLFEREDLIELIKHQRDVEDSRITDAELDIVLHALSFGEKTVSSIMVPKSEVQSVKESDVVGPILLDELYESKHSRFPVLSKDGAVIIGTMYLRDLVSAKHGGTASAVMKPQVYYVHEDQTLYHVLHAFLTTKHQLFVVINKHEKYVGIITIEDVLEQVIGHRIEDHFDSFEDRAAVARSVHTAPEAHRTDKTES